MKSIDTKFFSRYGLPVVLILILILLLPFSEAWAFNEFESWEEPQPSTPSPTPQPPPQKTVDQTEKKDTESSKDASKHEESTDSKASEKEDREGKIYRIGSFGVSPKLGYAWLEKMESSENFDVPTRDAFKVMLDLDFGGDGFGFRLSPYFSYQTAQARKCTTTILNGILPSQNCSDDDKVPIDYHFKALGLYFGSMYRFRIWNIHPSIGLGTQAAYLWDDNIEHGIELFGRLPLEILWYPTDHLAVVVEVAFLYGITGIQNSNKLKNYAINLDFNVGQGFGVDALVGIRFP